MSTEQPNLVLLLYGDVRNWVRRTPLWSNKHGTGSMSGADVAVSVLQQVVPDNTSSLQPTTIDAAVIHPVM